MKAKVLTLIWIMASIAIGGTVIGILLKILPNLTIDGERFKHPYYVCTWLFFGQSLLLGAHLLHLLKMRRKFGENILTYPEVKKAVRQGKSPYISGFIFAIPGIMDALRSVFLLLSIIYMPGSVANMMGALIVVFTTFFDKIFMKKTYTIYHIGGILLILCGVVIVNLTLILHSSNPESEEHKEKDYSVSELIFGILMMLISVITQSVQFIVEAKILEKYYVSKMRMIGFEGLWGFLFFVGFLIIAQNIHGSGRFGYNGVLEDSIIALKQTSHSFLAFSFLCIIGLLGMLLNYFGVLLTQLLTASHRATIYQIKIALIWIFFIFYSKFDTAEEFLWGQLIGFIILIIGVFIFNSVSRKTPMNLKKDQIEKRYGNTFLKTQEYTLLNQSSPSTSYSEA